MRSSPRSFQGDFLPDSASIFARQQGAVARAAAGVKTLNVTGLMLYNGGTVASTGTYDEATKQWQWTKPASAGGASATEDLRSQALKDRLRALGAP